MSPRPFYRWKSFWFGFGGLPIRKPMWVWSDEPSQPDLLDSTVMTARFREATMILPHWLLALLYTLAWLVRLAWRWRSQKEAEAVTSE